MSYKIKVSFENRKNATSSKALAFIKKWSLGSSDGVHFINIASGAFLIRILELEKYDIEWGRVIEYIKPFFEQEAEAAGAEIFELLEYTSKTVLI